MAWAARCVAAVVETALERRLSRRRLAEAGADDVAENALVDGGRVDAGAAHGFTHGNGTQFGRLEILQAAEELAGRRSHGADDDGFTHDGSLT